MQKKVEKPAGLRWFQWCTRCGVEREKRTDRWGTHFVCPKCGADAYPGGLGVL